MKRTLTSNIRKISFSDYYAGDSIYQLRGKSFREIVWLSKVGITIFLLLANFIVLQAQFIPVVSGGWDGGKLQGAGYSDKGSGKILLLDGVNNGCEGAAVYETTDTYNPCSGNFNKCYWVVFGCDDAGADGLAFTFSTCTAVTDYQVWGCGGGLGYVDACPGNKGITIEFDTFNNLGSDDFDTDYEGTGSDDEICIHKNMQAKTGPGKVTGVSVPNLEDGQEHRVCISYDNTTHVLSASIDGTTVISYDLDSSPGLDLETYFGCTGVNQSWSAGTNGAFNAQAVSNGPSLFDPGAKICPQMLPVEFVKLAANPTPSSVMVSWSTASEKNNEKFIIERSTDLSVWEAIGEVAGAGNSSSVIDYGFEDNMPLNGIIYYRIKQVDFDGAYAYSNAISVTTDVQNINVSPNPFNDDLMITTNISGEMKVSITDAMGRMVYQNNWKGENGKLSIHPQLVPGTYWVSIQSESAIEQLKVIKK